eukprot:TRINITY_DN3133_c0_g5_i3.p1 TRINITY_DN3133_c0_g5~~TRINITY_DN3133_c0_g5_i3.p1  ORF type:complete len:434 (-),score=128.39 TRINITY_DN3133_c0_g5_i3:161-1462(-)
MISRIFAIKPLGVCGRYFAAKKEMKDNFYFPSHKTHFSDDYYRFKYQPELFSEGVTMNAYKQLFDKREPTTYDWDKQKLKMESTIKDYIDRSDAQTMMKTTKEVLKRKALNREYEFTEEQRQKLIENQYGDYEKYLKNYTEVKPDKLESEKDKPVMDRAIDLMKKLEKDPAGRTMPELYEKISRYIWGANMKNLKELNRLKPPPDWNLNDEQKRLFDLLILEKSYGGGMLRGRLSPFARQEIYDLYLQGWSINDLSHKFGILVERVRAVIFQRQIFWNEIYPRMGVTAYNFGMKIEMIYGQQFGFMDYGLDFKMMAKDVRSLRLEKVTRSKEDRVLAPFEKDRIIKFYKNRRPLNKYTFIPEKFVGSGSKGYMIKSMKIWKGEGRVRPSKVFMDICRYVNPTERALLPDRAIKKLHLGPKRASQGYTIHRKIR